MPDDLVSILNTATPEEAHVLKNLLEAEGIEVYLEGELTGGTLWGASPNIGATKVKVKESDYEQAFTIANQAPSLDEETIESMPGQEASLDRNGSHEPEEETALDQVALRSFKAAVCGLFFIPLTFYSLYLVVRVIFDDGEMKKRGMGIVLTALAVDILTLLMWRFFLTF